MKGIEKYIESVCVQTAVHWKHTGSDMYGRPVYATPAEIKVRWEDTTQAITLSNGEQYVCRSKIMTNTDVQVGDKLCLCSLATADINKAWQVLRVDKVPMFRKTDEFVRTVYL